MATTKKKKTTTTKRKTTARKRKPPAVDPEFKLMVQAAVYAVAFVKYRDVMKGDAKVAAKWAQNMIGYIGDAMNEHAADINAALGKNE